MPVVSFAAGGRGASNGCCHNQLVTTAQLELAMYPDANVIFLPSPEFSPDCRRMHTPRNNAVHHFFGGPSGQPRLSSGGCPIIGNSSHHKGDGIPRLCSNRPHTMPSPAMRKGIRGNARSEPSNSSPPLLHHLILEQAVRNPGGTAVFDVDSRVSTFARC